MEAQPLSIRSATQTAAMLIFRKTTESLLIDYGRRAISFRWVRGQEEVKYHDLGIGIYPEQLCRRHLHHTQF
jgi:hypothetical protein